MISAGGAGKHRRTEPGEAGCGERSAKRPATCSWRKLWKLVRSASGAAVVAYMRKHELKRHMLPWGQDRPLLPTRAAAEHAAANGKARLRLKGRRRTAEALGGGCIRPGH